MLQPQIICKKVNAVDAFVDGNKLAVTCDKNSSQTVSKVSQENLDILAKSLQQDIPRSLPLLGSLKCNELQKVPYNFCKRSFSSLDFFFHLRSCTQSLFDRQTKAILYPKCTDVDRWPNFQFCLAVIDVDYFSNFEVSKNRTSTKFMVQESRNVIRPEVFIVRQKPPYLVLHFFGRNDDSELIAQLLNAVITDWQIPLLFYPGASGKQMTAIVDVLSQHGTVKFQDHVFCIAFATSASTIVTKTIPFEYELVNLTASDADVVADNWGYTKAPYEVEDLRKLMGLFPFYGIKCKADDTLIAQYGQLHNGACGVGWVHPQHRDKKLFQALISSGVSSVNERFGFAFAGVLKENSASWQAHLAVGLRSEDRHYVHWCQYIPSITGVTEAAVESLSEAAYDDTTVN